MIGHNATNYELLNEFKSVQSIVDVALSIARQGYQVMPMGANKKANWHFIPFDPSNLDEDGNPKKSTNLFIAENEFPTNEQVIEWATDWRTKGMSLITGIITVIDIDVPRFFDMWLACDGVRDVLERRRVPLMRSGGGGYQLPFVVSVPNKEKPKTSKVAWAKNEDKEEGREIAIEVKGFTQKMTCTYVMLPHSLHPNGNLYSEIDAFGGTYANIPMITNDEWDVLFSAAKSICEAPKAKSTLKREAEYKTWQAEQAKKPKRTFSRRNGESPIDRFNTENDIENMLDRYSYSRVSYGRWAYGSHRTNKSDISIVAGKSYHYNDNDPLANMGKKGITPFDVLFCYEYGGMRSRMAEAVRDLAEGYRIDYATQYEEERQAQQPQPMAAPVQPQPVPQPQPLPAPPMWFDEGFEDETYQPSDAELSEYYQDLNANSLQHVTSTPTAPQKPSIIRLEFEYDDYVTGLSDFAVSKMREYGKRVSIVKSPTGTGKSTDAMGPNSVVATPTQAITKQLMAKGMFGVLEGVYVGEIPPYTDLGVATTYNSLLRVTKELYSSQDIGELRLHTDEIHHILTDGGFRLKALNEVHQAMAYYPYNILMSATPFIDILTRTIFTDALVIEAKPINAVPVVPVPSHFVDSHSDVSLIIQQHEANPHAIGVLHANDKEYLKQVANLLNDRFGGAYLFTGDTKKEPHHIKMENENKLPDDCKFVLTTNIYNDGISLMPNEHYIIISAKSQLLAEELQQVIARQRIGKDMIKPFAIFIMKRESAKKPIELKSSTPYDAEGTFWREKAELEKVVSLLEKQRKETLELANQIKGDTAKGVLRASLDALAKDQFISAGKTYDDTYTVNEMALLNSVMARKRHTMTTGQLIYEMTLTGKFAHCGEFVVSELTLDQQVADLTKKAKADKNQTAKEQVQELFERAGGPTGIKALEIVTDNPDDYSKKVKDAVIMALSTWRDIEKLKPTLAGLMQLAKEKKAYTKSTLKTMRHQVLLSNLFELIKTESIEANAYDVQALRKLRSLISDGDKLDKSDIQRIRTEMMKLEGSKLVGRWDTEEKATRSIKRLFKSRRCKVGPKDDRKDALKVVGVYDFRTILKIRNAIKSGING